jgi:hypothetical protein
MDLLRELRRYFEGWGHLDHEDLASLRVLARHPCYRDIYAVPDHHLQAWRLLFEVDPRSVAEMIGGAVPGVRGSVRGVTYRPWHRYRPSSWTVSPGIFLGMSAGQLREDHDLATVWPPDRYTVIFRAFTDGTRPRNFFLNPDRVYEEVERVGGTDFGSQDEVLSFGDVPYCDVWYASSEDEHSERELIRWLVGQSGLV